MSIAVANLNNLSQADLDALVQNGVTESTSLEFKRETYGSSDSDRKELLKDVSAFANSMGGDLVIGIEEQGGVAAKLVPVTGNVDKEVDRLNQILRSGIEPSLIGVSIVVVQIDSGACIVVRIPRSALAPHRISAYNSSRFYVRHGRSAVEATIDELRNLFSRQREISERARDFHARTIGNILSGSPTSRPQGTAASFILLQMFPPGALAAAETVADFARHEFMELPLYGLAMGRSVLYTFDGVINFESDRERKAKALSAIYREGVLEYVAMMFLDNMTARCCFHRPTSRTLQRQYKIAADFYARRVWPLTRSHFVASSIAKARGLSLAEFNSIATYWSGRKLIDQF